MSLMMSAYLDSVCRLVHLPLRLCQFERQRQKRLLVFTDGQKTTGIVTGFTSHASLSMWLLTISHNPLLLMSALWVCCVCAALPWRSDAAGSHVLSSDWPAGQRDAPTEGDTGPFWWHHQWAGLCPSSWWHHVLGQRLSVNEGQRSTLRWL